MTGAFTPGDIFVSRSDGWVSFLIRLVARGTRRPPRPFRDRLSHAAIIVREDGQTVEQRIRDWRFWRGACGYGHVPAKNAWVLSPLNPDGSPLTGGQRRVIVTLAERSRELGVRYNVTGILAIGLAQNGVRCIPAVRFTRTGLVGYWRLEGFNWLAAKLADAGDEFCSQQVDDILTLVNVRMFNDGRPAGNVSPTDIADAADALGWPRRAVR